STVPLRGGGRNCQIAGGDRASRGNGIGRAGTGYDSPGGNAGQSEAVVEGEERFPVHSFVCQSAAAPDYGGAFATNIPRKAKAWSEVLRIGAIGAADLFSHLHDSEVGIEVAQQIIGIRNHRAKLVAQSQIYRQGPGHPPVILKEPSIVPVMQMPPRITREHGCLERVAGKEILQCGGSVGIRRCRSQGDATQESNAAAGVAKRSTAHVVPMDLAAEFQSVFSCGVGDVVDELDDIVGALKLGPLEAAQSGEEVSAKADTRQPSSVWTAHARIEA